MRRRRLGGRRFRQRERRRADGRPAARRGCGSAPTRRGSPPRRARSRRRWTSSRRPRTRRTRVRRLAPERPPPRTGRERHGPFGRVRRLEQLRQRGGHVALLAAAAELRQTGRQREPHLARRREPVVRVLRGRLPHHLCDGRGDGGRETARIAAVARVNRLDDLRVGPVEGAFAGEAFVQDHAGRPDVAATVLANAADALGRGVAVLADEHGRWRRARGGARRAEVDQLGAAAGRDDDVVGADVAMHEAQRAARIGCLVNVLERVADVRDHVQNGRDRQPLAARAHALVRDPQRDAGDVLHRDEVAPFQLTEIEDVNDVRVRKLRGDRGLADEHLHQLGAVLQRGEHRLDDDSLLESLRPLDLRAPHLRHPPRGQARFNLVLAELLPRPPGRRRRGIRRDGLEMRRRRLGSGRLPRSRTSILSRANHDRGGQSTA